MGYIVEAIDNEGTEWVARYSAKKSEIEELFDSGNAVFNGKPVKLIRMVSDRDHHICRYCKGIADGRHADLLCDNCRQTFGHALYSEL